MHAKVCYTSTDLFLESCRTCLLQQKQKYTTVYNQMPALEELGLGLVVRVQHNLGGDAWRLRPAACMQQRKQLKVIVDEEGPAHDREKFELQSSDGGDHQVMRW